MLSDDIEYAEEETTDPDYLARFTPEDDDDVLSLYLPRLSRYNLLSPEEEKDLARRVQAGDEEAFHTMVNANLRLVVRTARKYLKSGMRFADLIQEGNIGLMHAIRKFDPDMGFRVSTYAMFWIRQTVERAIMTQYGLIRLPVNVTKQIRKMVLKSQEMTVDGIEPTHAELAEALGEPVAVVEHWRTAVELNHMTDLMSAVGGVPRAGHSASLTVQETVADESRDPDAFFHSVDMVDQVRTWIQDLSERERNVLDHRYGLTDGVPKNIAETAAALGLPRETVKSSQHWAERSLREIAERHGHLNYQ